MEHLGWPYAILWMGVILALGQARVSEARLKKMQIQMRALLRHLNVENPTALPTPSAKVVEALERHGKFAAVKAYWDETGAGIKECKEVVEELQEDAHWRRPPTT